MSVPELSLPIGLDPKSYISWEDHPWHETGRTTYSPNNDYFVSVVNIVEQNNGAYFGRPIWGAMTPSGPVVSGYLDNTYIFVALQFARWITSKRCDLLVHLRQDQFTWLHIDLELGFQLSPANARLDAIFEVTPPDTLEGPWLTSEASLLSEINQRQSQ